MKSFFKKLSLVLVAAMVITMLPMNSAKAAAKITLGVDKASAAKTQEYTFDVNETQKWGFFGVADYNAAGAKTKVWKSSNPAVVEVNNGQVTAKAVGTATISLTLKNNGVDYAGSAKITVKSGAAEVDVQDFGDFTIAQTAWNAVTITFADNETAAAAKKAGIKVERVKESAKLANPFYLYVNASVADPKDGKLVVTGLNDGCTYRFTCSAVKAQPVLTMHVGDPAELVLSYDTVEIGEGKNIVGTLIKKPSVLPTVKVVDANGVECNVVTKNYVKFTATNKSGCNFTSATGKITFNDVKGSVTVKASFNAKDSDGKLIPLSDEVTVTPVQYQAPSLQGFVEQICLVKPGTDPKKITYPTDYTFEATMAVKDKMQIAYYFLGTDDIRYTGNNVKDAVSYDTDKTTGIKVIDPDREFYFIKDNGDLNVVSCTKGGVIVAQKEGTERICLYECAKKGVYETNTDMLVGVIDITVEAEPVCESLILEDAKEGEIFTNNGLNNKKEITYKAIDQYDNEIPVTVELVDNEGKPLTGAWLSNVQVVAGEKRTTGKIVINYAGLPTTNEAKEITAKVKYTDVAETFLVEVVNIPSQGDETYELVVNDFAFNANTANAAFDTAQIEIKVAKAIDGNNYTYVPFTLIADAEIEKASLQNGFLYVQITDSEGNVVTKDATGDLIATSWDTENTCYPDTVATAYFDIFDEGANKTIVEALLTGTYHVTLYNKKATADVESEADFTVENKFEGIKNFSTTKIKAKDKKDGVEDAKENGKVVDCWSCPASGTKSEIGWVRAIATEMMGWLDINSDGKYQSDEVKKLRTLCGSDFEVVEEESKWVLGADGKELYIKMITITYEINDTKFEQAITIDKKFRTNGCK